MHGTAPMRQRIIWLRIAAAAPKLRNFEVKGPARPAEAYVCLPQKLLVPLNTELLLHLAECLEKLKESRYLLRSCRPLP